MNARLSLALLALTACVRAPPHPEPAPPPAAVRPAAPKPTWVGAPPFVVVGVSGVTLYAAADAPLEATTECPDPRAALEVATGRARAALARAVAPATDGVAIGTTSGVEVAFAWFDTTSVHVLASMSLAEAPAGVRVETAPVSGDRPATAGVRLVEDARAKLDASGACRDPHRRLELPCCGPLDEMCHDDARIDTRPAPNKCGCGAGPPCLDDFACAAGKCVCKGPKCPCEILNCRAGQQCADHRCY